VREENEGAKLQKMVYNMRNNFVQQTRTRIEAIKPMLPFSPVLKKQSPKVVLRKSMIERPRN